MTPAASVDLLSPEMQRDPFPAFDELRATVPVAWSERHRGWLLTRYDDVAAAFREPRLSADRMTPTFARLAPDVRRRVELAERHLTRWLVFMDPPAHDRLRRLVSRAFTPPRMEAVRDQVRAMVDELLDTWEGQDEVDVVSSLAHPLPTSVVAAVLGIPASDYVHVSRWSNDVSAVVFGTGSNPARFDRAQAGLAEFDAYIRERADDVRRGRGAPGLIADLVAIHDEDRGQGGLDEDELVATCTLLLLAGDETTTGLIDNAFAVLAEHEEERRRIEASVDELAPSAAEELLRYAGPTRAMVRVAMDDVALPSGGVLPRGDRSFLLVAAANRDPQRFPEPHRFIADRRDNVHLGFGSGIHHCLGAPLARIEMQEVLRGLVRRFPNWELASAPRWGGGLLGFSAGPLRVRSGPPAAGGRGRR